jgi:hypothetical protein
MVLDGLVVSEALLANAVVNVHDVDARRDGVRVLLGEAIGVLILATVLAPDASAVPHGVEHLAVELLFAYL